MASKHTEMRLRERIRFLERTAVDLATDQAADDSEKHSDQVQRIHEMALELALGSPDVKRLRARILELEQTAEGFAAAKAHILANLNDFEQRNTRLAHGFVERSRTCRALIAIIRTYQAHVRAAPN